MILMDRRAAPDLMHFENGANSACCRLRVNNATAIYVGQLFELESGKECSEPLGKCWPL